MKNPNKKDNFTLRITAYQRFEIEQIAKQMNVSCSTVIRAAIEHLINTYNHEE